MIPIYLLLFFLSGLAALVYEVVWLHLLRLSIGVSTYSLGLILIVFMGGMAVGSLLCGTMVKRSSRPLKIYAALEAGIGLFGLAMPYLLMAGNSLYVKSFRWHDGSILVRALVAGFALLPPTALMGATLPVMARCFARDRRGAARLGSLYGANIFGAVAGSLLAGLFLMHYFDAVVASLVAASINIFAAVVAWVVASAYPANGVPQHVEQAIGQQGSDSGEEIQSALIIATVLLSGFTALGAEVIWTRLLTLSLGPTVYAFALVLAVFLAGLGIGSSIASTLLPFLRHPLLALAACQLGLIFVIPLAANSFAEPSLMRNSFWLLSFADEWPTTMRDLTRAFLTVFPSAVLWGASFPLAVAVILPRQADQARSVGTLYAANTIGAICGAVGASFVLVPCCGTRTAQQALVAASAAASWCCLAGYFNSLPGRKPQHGRIARAVSLLAVFAVGVIGVENVRPPSPALFAYGREAAQRRRDAPFQVVREGVHTPIVVTLWPQHNHIRALHLAGKLEASDDKIDLRLERMLGHIPQFLCDDPNAVLVVGLGAGITAGSFVMDSRTQDIMICELEPALPPITAEYFARANRNVLGDPRTNLVVDDGRHFLQITRQKFDVISVDPIHPWVRGAAALYSEEFFRECLDHLRSGGAVSYWVPMHSMTVEAVKSEIATFFNVFPYAMVWHTGGTIVQRHMLLVGSDQPFALDLRKIDSLSESGTSIDESIREMEFASVDDLLKLYVADKGSLEDWVKGAQINSDMSLKLEYLAGAAAYQNNREEIFRDIVAHRTWPAEIFRGDETRLAAIRDNLDQFDALEDAVPKR